MVKSTTSSISFDVDLPFEAIRMAARLSMVDNSVLPTDLLTTPYYYGLRRKF